LYFGIAADLSPPVALAAYAGAGIAGDDPMKTGGTAIRLAIAGFLVPYIYVYNPMLVLVGFEVIPFTISIGTALLGVFLLGAGSIGFYKVSMPLWLRAVAVAGALNLLVPGIYSDAIGFAVLAGIHIIQVRKARSLDNPAVTG
ncbi:MAG TPA: TRAP transporter large permease subunit, partial [Synergistales bacterium]|nr:TRAP transporter large permease subunit [Synergistales bacterium]